jgi:hypothetical protein
MIALRVPNGLGDAIYLRAIVLHLLKRGEGVAVFTKWRDVFSDLPVQIRETPEAAAHQVRYLHNSSDRALPKGMTDFAMRCRQAGIKEPVELRMDWQVRNPALLDQIKRDAAGRKILVYQCARQVRSEASALLKPRRAVFNKFIADHDDYYRIKIGHPPHVEDDQEAKCELDLFGKAFIHDSFDIGTIGDLLFGQHCFVLCMAEAMNKPYVCMFARAALKSNMPQANTTTPDRCFNKKHLATAIYDD